MPILLKLKKLTFINSMQFKVMDGDFIYLQMVFLLLIKDGLMIMWYSKHQSKMLRDQLLFINIIVINHQHMVDGDFIIQQIQIWRMDGLWMVMHLVYSRIIPCKILFLFINITVFSLMDGDSILVWIQMLLMVGHLMLWYFTFIHLEKIEYIYYIYKTKNYKRSNKIKVIH